MESASSSSSSGTTSTLANNTLTTSIPPTTNTTQTLSSMATSPSARTSPRTISGTTSTTSTNTTSSDQSIISSSTATTTTSTTTTSSRSSASTASSTTSASTTSTTTLSSSFSSSSTLISTTTTTSSSPSPTSTTSSSLTPIVLPKTTTSTDDSALTPTPTATVATVITTVLTSTGSNGTVVTITQVQVNPTLSPNDNGYSVNSTFFSNTGAVAGTFILVGLTVASILLWILFYVRRRRRRRQLEHESAVSATLAAAGLYRSPLDDDDLQDGAKQSPYGASPDVDMNQRSGSRVGIATVNSQPSNGRLSAFSDAPDPEAEAQNPLAEFGVSRRDGYMPARTSSPDAHYTRDRQGSTSTGGFVKGHSTNHSVGSYEPLLASYNRPSNPSPPSPTVPLQPLAPIAGQDATAPVVASQNDTAPVVASQNATTTAGPSTDKPLESTDNSEDTDGRLDPNIRQRLENGGDNASARELRDEEDYSRPVLQVRNLSDSASRES